VGYINLIVLIDNPPTSIEIILASEVFTLPTSNKLKIVKDGLAVCLKWSPNMISILGFRG